jgi:hypothetical protein
VIGVQHVLEMLEPVAGRDGVAAAADAGVVGVQEFALVEDFQAFVARQHRFLLGRPHVGEDQAVLFAHRVPGLTHTVAEAATLRFAGLLQAAAFDVEQPAVVAAADAALLDLAVVERGPAMRAARVHQPRPAGLVTEQDQVLAQDPHFARHLRGVRRQPDRVPVAAQQVAHRRGRTDLGQGREVSRSLAAEARANVELAGGGMIVHGVPPSTLRRPAARDWRRMSRAALVRRNSRPRGRVPGRPAPLAGAGTGAAGRCRGRFRPDVPRNEK